MGSAEEGVKRLKRILWNPAKVRLNLVKIRLRPSQTHLCLKTYSWQRIERMWELGMWGGPVPGAQTRDQKNIQWSVDAQWA